MINPIWGGGGADSAPLMTFSTVAPWKTVKVGVMGYQNLSYCTGKTPRKVSGPKFIWALFSSRHSRTGAKFECFEIWSFSFSARISTLKSIGSPKNDHESCFWEVSKQWHQWAGKLRCPNIFGFFQCISHNATTDITKSSLTDVQALKLTLKQKKQKQYQCTAREFRVESDPTNFN